MKIKVWAFAVAAGLVWGGMVCLVTIIEVMRGGGHFIYLLRIFYLGYRVSWTGSIIGLGWGFLSGLALGAVFAWIYNLLSGNKPAR